MRFYVYELVIVPDGKVCYVGKGSGDRLNHHAKVVSNPRHKQFNRPLYRKLRAVIETGRTFSPRIVIASDSETAALVHEHALIEKHGFSNLFNTASHAFLGRKLKPEVCAEISRAITEKWRSGAYKNKRTNAGRKFPYQPKLALRKPKDRRSAKTGFKGVSEWNCTGKSKRWTARISNGGIVKSLGYFHAPIDAARAYDNAAEKYYGTRPNGTEKT